jgi:conjugal transfer pilus assembly protein TraF
MIRDISGLSGSATSKLFCFLFFSLTIASPTFGDDRFWDDGKRGYYWYEDPIVDPEIKALPTEEEKLPPSSISKVPEPDNYTYEALFDLYPDKFQVVIDQRLKHAVHKPTEESVKRFLEAADVAKKKSRLMANVAGYVALQNPQLTGESRYPINQPGRRAFIEKREKEVREILEQYHDRYAIVAFYQEGCSYCVAQDQMLEHFKFMYQWPVRKIDIHQDPQLAAKFNVSITPTLLLVSREKEDQMLLSSGVISFEDLTERVYRMVRILEGLSDPERFYDMGFEEPVKNGITHTSYKRSDR